MHSSTLDSVPSPVLHIEHPSSTHSSPGSLRDGGELLVAVATLVTEGRIPIQTPAHKRCNIQLTNSQQGSPGGGKGQGQQHQRGFYEGPHCGVSLSALAAGSKGGGGSPQRMGGGMAGGLGMGQQLEPHCCNPTDTLCQKYEKVRSEVLNLWQKGIPLCVEVFLKHTCDVSLDAGNGSLLLERWYLSVSHFRSPSDISSNAPTQPPLSSNPTVFHNFHQLISAIRSQLYFSQISAWLSPTPTPTPNNLSTPLSFHYRLAIPGETFDTSTFSCSPQPPHTHTFPGTDLGNGLLLNVKVESLPRVERGASALVGRCSKCGEGVGEEATNKEGSDGGRRSVSPAEGSQCGGLFDDRMHTRCTLKGKHRCDDLDDFDGAHLNHSEHQQLLSGKYKRLCHNDSSTAQQRSPQRATFTTPRRLSTSNLKNPCDCQQQQLPSTSSSSSSSKKVGGAGGGSKSGERTVEGEAARVNKGVRFCYQSFGDVFDVVECVQDGIATGKGGVDELNQNEKRNSVQRDAEEPHKTPKLDLDDRLTPLEINVLDGLAVIPTDLNKQQHNKSPIATGKPSANTNASSNTGDFLLMNSILRSCRNDNADQQQKPKETSGLLLQQQSNGNNNNNNNAAGKCDVKCVQRLGRIGTSILHGCSRVLQTVSDTTTSTTTTNSDIFNLSQNSKVNNTVYVDDENTYQHQDGRAKSKPCKMRDISNTTKYQSFDESANNVQYSRQPSKYQPVRRKITFDDEEIIIPSSAISKPKQQHPDSPIPRLPRSFNFPSSSVCQKLTFDDAAKSSSSTITSSISSNPAANSIEIPSPLDKAQFRKSLDNAASMVFHARTGLPLTSSPAPVRRGTTCFGYDDSIDSVSAIKSALFPGCFSTDDDSESDGSIVSPCSPDAFLSQQQPQAASYYSHATVLTKNQHQHHHHHHHVKHSNNNNNSLLSTVQQQQNNHHSNKRRGTSSSHLLGTFEESALNGRLEPAATVHGFKAELGASGSFVPPHRIVPVTVFFYTFGDSDKVSSPYLGHINLGKKGYNVPRTGTVQVTLFNPLGTVVKMFVIMYDLADMPNNSQTFIRQRTLYMPTNCKDANLEWGPKWLRYLIHLRFMSSKSGKIYLHSDIRMIIFRKCDLDTATAHGMDMCYELRSFTHMPQNPKYSPRK